MTPAELWRKLLRVSAFRGAGAWEEGRAYKHLGIEFTNGEGKGSAASYLKQMVEYNVPVNCTPSRLEEIDTAAWHCVMNFEEVRTVGKPGFALTNTYMGWAGIAWHNESHNEHHKLIEWLIEFDEDAGE